MRLTRHADYSLRVLMFLAVSPQHSATIAQISEAYGISRNHLMKVVQKLARLGYVHTSRGKGGGLILQNSPENIPIGQVVRDMEPDFALVECFGSDNHCVISPQCKLQNLLTEALEGFFSALDRYTLYDLTATPQPLIALLTLAPQKPSRSEQV